MPESSQRLCGSASEQKILTSEAIKDRAREMGFDLCGVAPAQAFPELAFFKQWIARGYAGTMGYLPRSAGRRADVRNVVPSAPIGHRYRHALQRRPAVLDRTLPMPHALKSRGTRGATTITM